MNANVLFNNGLLEELLDSNVDDKASSTAVKVRKDNYRELVKFGNVSSYSMQQTLLTCPRKFKLQKLRADNEEGIQDREPNADFAFGHAVGAGVAEYDRTRSLSEAIWAAFLAWNIDLLAEGKRKESGKDPKKSFAHAVWALKLYETFYLEEGLDSYSVEVVEATIGVDMEDGFFYVGHVDELLKEKETGRLKVKENKTTVFDAVDPALYANSDQALSYAVVVDAFGASEYDVFYCIYSSSSQRWIGMPFVKTALAKSEWLQGQLLLNSELSEYSRLNFFPKRGSGCYTYSRRCEFFESCDFNSDKMFGKKFEELRKAEGFQDIEEIEKLDFKITFSQLVSSQESKIAEEDENVASPAQPPAGFGTKSGMETL